VPTTRSAEPVKARPRTLWEAGRHPGALVVRAVVVVLALVVVLDVVLDGRLGVPFDVTLVALSVAAALWVRPPDFFTVGVLPPLLLAATVVTLVAVDRGSVAQADDAALQAVVSGLAHHALALLVGYAATLAILALRQVALRNHGALRPKVGAAQHAAEQRG
jgi:hypothetical protein